MTDKRDAAEGESPAVLVVEDDPAQRQCLRRLLQTDWDVFYSESIGDAEACLARNPHIGILLCDHELPDGNGLDYCERLYKRNSPVVRILVTGHTQTALLVQAVNTQCLFHFLAKPYANQELLSVLTEASKAYSEVLLSHQTLLEKDRAKTSSVKENISHWAQIIFGVGSFLIATVLIVLVVTLVLGTIVFVLLYVLKSFLGIDIFADRHLEDFLPF